MGGGPTILGRRSTPDADAARAMQDRPVRPDLRLNELEPVG
jgi:hypothetical protein